MNADENNDIGDGSVEYYRGAMATYTGKGKGVAGATKVNLDDYPQSTVSTK